MMEKGHDNHIWLKKMGKKKNDTVKITRSNQKRRRERERRKEEKKLLKEEGCFAIQRGISEKKEAGHEILYYVPEPTKVRKEKSSMEEKNYPKQRMKNDI